MGRKKGYKIKRYNNIFGRKFQSRVSPLKVVAIVAALAVLFMLGWALYQPIYDLITGNTPRPSEPSAPSQGDASTSDEGNSSTEEPPQEVEDNGLHSIYVPQSVLADETQLDTLIQSLEGTEINTVVFELKADDGTVLYQSQLELVAQANAQSEDAFSLTEVTEKLKAANLRPVGILHAFQDHLATRLGSTYPIKYNNTDVTWLDDFPDQGGRSWLNPYSADAQAYVTSLANEAVEMGVTDVVLDSVFFPTMGGSESATYGAESNNKTRQQVLTEFVSSVRTSLAEQGAQVWLKVDATDLFEDSSASYGGDPLAVSGGYVMVSLVPEQFGTSYTSDAFTIENPVTTPGQTVEQAMAAIKTLAGSEAYTYWGILQAYTSQTVTGESGKTYTAADIQEQIQGLAAQGVLNYSLWNPEGSYDLEE